MSRHSTRLAINEDSKINQIQPANVAPGNIEYTELDFIRFFIYFAGLHTTPVLATA